MREAFGARFDVGVGYLNSASIAIPPQQTLAAVTEAVAAWGRGGALSGDFDEPVRAARQAYADLVGVSVDRVAIGPSASALIGLVAANLPDGARVVVAEGDFTSVPWPFAAQAERGITVREVPLDAIAEAAREADVVAVSVVQSLDGRVVDLEGLRAAVRDTDTIVVLDATQAVGWLPDPLDWADAVIAAGYKWLLSPRGCAWGAFSERLDRVRPAAANWYAGADRATSMYGMPLRLADDARRLDVSPAWYSHVGASVSLPWLAGLDLPAVRDHCVGLADDFLARLDLPPQGSAIVAIDSPDPAAIERLREAGVVGTARSGRLRFSFALYNTEADVDAAVGALRAAY
ncbi:aminotransferase class V-fold PLP-dependent enzyme [Enemella evansiae]|uniref:aminotransferase class V-fold PLP-dependent enzyme n=1 Tax=Enemella evansiae TaxID=2016499 RepID=UPI000B9736EF|nr:aminotransferase class V-fold PLP-dependent enzyme [Enemella evansiae]OYO00355.1 aminotransferase [Enemella evansiae]OYO03655.1 aminotransferase [Enemella evansiae]PFG68410.1 selenocysteine lyase/cysteine desulfurase [Propionibacteriaceae bacterium ES.041]